MVSARDPDPLLPEHRERGGARMPEVVACPDAYARHLRRPGIQRLLRQAVGAPVVRDLEHLDLVKRVRRQKLLLDVALGIACQYHLELAAIHKQHDARVVGSERVTMVAGRPQDAHARLPELPAVPRLQEPHLGR